jgi:hypothetical protein
VSSFYSLLLDVKGSFLLLLLLLLLLIHYSLRKGFLSFFFGTNSIDRKTFGKVSIGIQVLKGAKEIKWVKKKQLLHMGEL